MRHAAARIYPDRVIPHTLFPQGLTSNKTGIGEPSPPTAGATAQGSIYSMSGFVFPNKLPSLGEWLYFVSSNRLVKYQDYPLCRTAR